MYIHELPDWPHFEFDTQRIFSLLEECHLQQGRLLSSMGAQGLAAQNEKVLSVITGDVIKSSEIEGCDLNQAQVRSSIARRLGITIEENIVSSRDVEGTVEMMLDATQNYGEALTVERLFGWHACLFPTGYSGMHKIDVAKYRPVPMQVVSGALGKERIHYEAPAPEKVPAEMERFLAWLNSDSGDFLLNAATAHLWFVSIHPFEDGNGRIARAISDMLLCRSDRTRLRFYSMSAQILKDKKNYYDVLERTQRGRLDITDWLEWFLNCLLKALAESREQTETVLKKYRFLHEISSLPLNERQRMMVERLLDGSWFGVLNTSKWAKIAKCSTDTALRDINDLIAKNILEKSTTAGGRSTNYRLESQF